MLCVRSENPFECINLRIGCAMRYAPNTESDFALKDLSNA